MIQQRIGDSEEGWRSNREPQNRRFLVATVVLLLSIVAGGGSRRWISESFHNACCKAIGGDGRGFRSNKVSSRPTTELVVGPKAMRIRLILSNESRLATYLYDTAVRSLSQQVGSITILAALPIMESERPIALRGLSTRRHVRPIQRETR